ncbi:MULTISPECIES: HNH endonuclease [unclassified Streptomyces]|uniref:HNH endonuclease n=1 Tax=unclassified Streptomyces TaxID=2593676 RepID=UPI0036F12CF2
MAVRYTRELLEEAAREVTNFDDAVRWCGGTPTAGSRRYLRQKMAEAKIDTSHLQKKWVRYTEEALREAVAHSSSVTEVLRRLGISPVGGSHTHISRRIASLGIDVSHFAVRRGNPGGSRNKPLMLGSPRDGRTDGARLRRELLRIGIPERCTECGTGTVWNDKPLRLEVDHRNGNWWDNRAENLQFLCPNCHSATDTYRGRKRRAA